MLLHELDTQGVDDRAWESTPSVLRGHSRDVDAGIFAQWLLEGDAGLHRRRGRQAGKPQRSKAKAAARSVEWSRDVDSVDDSDVSAGTVPSLWSPALVGAWGWLQCRDPTQRPRMRVCMCVPPSRNPSSGADQPR